MYAAFPHCTLRPGEGPAAEGTRARGPWSAEEGRLQAAGSRGLGPRGSQEQSAVLPWPACCLVLACVCVGVWCGAPLPVLPASAVLNPWDMCVSHDPQVPEH